MGGLVKFVTGKSGKKAAKRQAEATIKSANMQANSDRLNAQAAVQAQQTMLAQQRASTAAAELLSQPQEKIDVSLAPDSPPAEIDPDTGRRRTTRSSFTSKGRGGSGIRL